MKILCNSLVCRSKASIVATSTQELIDSTLASLADGNLLQQLDIFAVFIMLLQVAENSFLFENVTGRGVNVLFAAKQQDKYKKQARQVFLHVFAGKVQEFCCKVTKKVLTYANIFAKKNVILAFL
jgi:hypothetical protein